jgi:hypothetical protein
MDRHPLAKLLLAAPLALLFACSGAPKRLADADGLEGGRIAAADELPPPRWREIQAPTPREAKAAPTAPVTVRSELAQGGETEAAKPATVTPAKGAKPAKGDKTTRHSKKSAKRD